MARIRTVVITAAALIASTATLACAALASASPVPHAVAHHGAISLVVAGDTTHPIVLAHGAINAAGKDDPNHDNYDVATFAHGSFRIVHPQQSAKFVSHIDKVSCYATFTESGRFTLAAGTGAYKGIKGAGKYSAQGYAYVPRTKAGACNLDAEPTHEIVTVLAGGSLK